MAKNLSRRMPIAERSPLNFEDYEVEKGTALSITTSVAEMNRFYHPAKGLEGATAWQGGIGSVSYGRSLSNFDDALDFVNTFEFPQEWRVKIEKAAHRLQEAFQATLKPMITRDQFSGNFDFDKLPDLHMQLAQGTVEMDKLLPYWTYEMKPPKKPTVAIIGAGSWADMWGHPLYIPMVAALSTAVTWACQAADYHCYSAMVQGNARRVPERYKYLVNAFMFASPYDTVTLRDYAVLFHRDLYRWGWMTAHSAVMDTHKRLYELFDWGGHYSETSLVQSIGSMVTSGDGGYAVEWARNYLKAEIVIVVGSNVLDTHLADAVVMPDMDLEPAISEIIKQAAQKF